MSVKIKDSNDVIYTFNATFRPNGFSFKKRSEEKDIAFSHGISNTGDKKIDKRSIKVTGYIHSSSQTTYDNELNELLLNCNKENFKLYFDDTKYINISEMVSFTDEREEGLDGYVSKITLEFLAADPFFYRFVQTNQFEYIDSSPKQFSIHNPGNIEVFPVLGLTTSILNSEIAIRNITAGLSCLYQDSTFTAGQTVLIDCNEGTVFNGETDTIRYFSGLFMNLLPGTNLFEVSGSTPCGLSISFYRRDM